VVDLAGTSCGFRSSSSYVAIESPDSPKYPFRHVGWLGLIDLANVHSSAVAGNLKHVSIRGTHFKYAVLIAESFYRTLDLCGAVSCIEHLQFLPRKKKSTKTEGWERETKRIA
jgi:hypothetical protein